MFLSFIFMLGVFCGCPGFVVAILSLAFAGVFWVVIAFAVTALGYGILSIISVHYIFFYTFVFFFFAFLVVGYWKIIRDYRKECKERKEWEIEKREKELGIWKDKT